MKKYIAGDSLWKNTIDLVHHENIYFNLKYNYLLLSAALQRSESETDGFYDKRLF